MDSGLAWLAIVGVLNSVVSAYYYVRVIRVMFLQQSISQESVSTPISSLIALTLAGTTMLWIGIAPGYIMRVTQSAASVLGG